MRILYVITRSELGGAQAVVLTYLQALRSEVDIALASGEEGFLSQRARSLGVSVFILPDLVPPVAPQQDRRAVRALCKTIRQYQPDLVHAHSSKAGLLGRLAARLVRVPSVFTAHGFAFTENASFLRRVIAVPCEWVGARLGQSLIAVSEYDRALAERFCISPRNPVNVVHNGLPEVPFRARPEDGSSVNIVMVARFAPPKDHRSVLDALTYLEGNFKVWFVGDGPTLPQVRAQAIRAGMGDRVTFMGARHDVPGVLSTAHIFVLASDYEGLPISILEAMRAALPVVASDVGGVSECVCDGSTGFLVPRANINVLQQRLQSLVASPVLRGRMGQAGRRLFERRFTAGAMVRETLHIYQAILESSPKRTGTGFRSAASHTKIATAEVRDR